MVRQCILHHKRQIDAIVSALRHPITLASKTLVGKRFAAFGSGKRARAPASDIRQRITLA